MEKKAKAEEERIKQLGYDRKREEDEAAARRKMEEEARKEKKELGGPAKSDLGATRSYVPSATATAASSQPKGNTQDMSRLGMGMKRLGLGTVASAPVTPKSSCVTILLFPFTLFSLLFVIISLSRFIFSTFFVLTVLCPTPTSQRRRATNSAGRRASHQICSLGAAHTIPQRLLRHNNAYSPSRVRPPSHPRNISVVTKRRNR